jgi:hypothetical protein
MSSQLFSEGYNLASSEGGISVNLLETHLRADVVRGYMSGAFERFGFKTEARLLRIQSQQLIKLIDKALEEMPAIDPWEGLSSILGGEMTSTYRQGGKSHAENTERCFRQPIQNQQ